MIKLINGDCLEEMDKLINDGVKVNLVLTDPPYNINHKSNDWDNFKKDEYLSFMREIFNKCYNLLEYNGTLIFFHNNILSISELIKMLNDEFYFNYNSFIILDKGNFRSLSWKNPSSKSNLRSWFNTCEYIIIFTKGDEIYKKKDKTGWDRVRLDINNFKTLREYSKDLLNYMGVTRKDVERKLGHRKAEHFFYTSTQWSLCTEEVYNELVKTYNLRNWECFREYEDLRLEYEDLRLEYEDLRLEYEDLRLEYEHLRPVHNLDNNHNNLWKFKRDKEYYHSCQKPINILERLIRTHSNEGDTVLDCFMGSGSTGVACKNLNRGFIGIELDENYYEIANERINSRL